MFIYTTSLAQVELTSAIVRNPLVVTPDTTLPEAIAQMSGVRLLCQTPNAAYSQLDLDIASSIRFC
jgi:CBS domain-containing protein